MTPSITSAEVLRQFAGSRISRHAISLRSAAALPWFIAIVVVALLTAPRAAHVCLLLLALAYWTPWVPRQHSFGMVFRKQPVQIALTVCAYLLVIGLCAPDWQNGFRTAAGMAIVIVFSTVAASWHLNTEQSDWHRLIALATARSILVGAAIVAADLISGQAVTTAFLQTFPSLAERSMRHLIVENGAIAGVYKYVLNRNVGVLNLVLWPALALFFAVHCPWQSRRAAALCQSALFALAVLATFLSEHESSKVAIVLATFVFVLAKSSPAKAVRLIALAWVAACLLVAPVTKVAHWAHMHDLSWLSKSAQGRVIRWSTISDRIMDAPVLGSGINATQVQWDEAHATTDCDNDEFVCNSGRHPHNVYLQIWYELGLTGVLLFTLCGLGLLRQINTLPHAIRPYGLAALTSAASIVAFSWSAWQTWLYATICISGMLIVLAHIVSRDAVAHREVSD